MDKPWLACYPENVPHEIDPDKYTNLLDVFEESVTANADLVAFSNMGKSVHFREIEVQSRAFAAYLQEKLKLAKGDRIALMMPNCLQYPVCLFGALRAGLTVVNVNPLYTARELRHQLNDSGAKCIVIVANFASTLEKVLKDTALEHVIITELGDMLAWPKRSIVNAVVKYVKKMVPAYHFDDFHTFSDVLSLGAQMHYQRPVIESDDLAFLQYTGGTTGDAKGAMLSHRNMIANLLQANAIVGPTLRAQHELVVTALPLYHIFALLANGLLFFMLGCHNLLITNPRDLPAFIKELKRYPFTAITGVNTLFNALLNHPQFETLDFSNLRLSLGGGMAVQAAVAERWQSLTGCRLLEGYGLTECAPLVTVSPYNQQAYNGSIGLPAPSTLVRLVDENNADVAQGERGELLVFGPQVMQGYWQAPAASDEVLKEGWFATGDIGYMDEQGYFYIVDRKKDMILVSGFNVYPNEVEAVLAEHDEVVEAAVIGEPHENSGERVKAYVVRKSSGLTERELIDFCKQHLTAYKVPKEIEFRDELPKTNVGKILRRALREQG